MTCNYNDGQHIARIIGCHMVGFLENVLKFGTNSLGIFFN
jgi:hypothetical protein